MKHRPFRQRVTFEGWTLNYTAPASGGQVGGVLGVELQGSGNNNGQFNYDNIMLACGIATTTALVSSKNPSSGGVSVTLTATVGAPSGTSAPTSGTVTFYDNGSNCLGAVSLNSSSQASVSTSTLANGTHAITAAYGGNGNAGSDNYGGSIGTVSQGVGYASITVVPSQNPSLFGGAVTLTATVTGGSTTPTGTVTFYDGAASLGTGTLNSSGVANFSTASLPLANPNAPLSITAVYSGNVNYFSGTSSVLSQTNTAPSTITVGNFSFEITQSGETINSGGSCDCMTTPGAYTVGFASGDSWTGPSGSAGEFNPSSVYTSGSAPNGHNVGWINAAGLAITQTLSATPAANSFYVLTGYVGSRDDQSFWAGTTTTIELLSGATVVGGSSGDVTGPANGTFETWSVSYTSPSSGVPTGALEISLGGPANGNQANYDAIALACGFPTKTALTSTQNPSTLGGSVTLTATISEVTGSSPPTTGTVTFMDGTVTLAAVAVNGSGVATFTTGTLPTGTQSITAAYGGNGNSGSDNYGGSISSALSQVVNLPAVVSSQNPSLAGGAVTFTTTFTGSPLPTGTVTYYYTNVNLFYTNGANLGTVTITSSGVASASTSNLPIAIASSPNLITAVYSGDNNYGGGASGALSQMVSGPSSITIGDPGFETPVPDLPHGEQQHWIPVGPETANYAYTLNPLHQNFYPRPNGVNGPLPPPAGGDNVAQMDDGGAISQTLTGFTEAANTTYVLTGVVGHEAYPGLNFGQPTAQLIAGSTTLINDTTIPSPPGPTPGNENNTGLFEVWSATYTSASSVTSGQTLAVGLGETGGNVIVDFDNIALACGISNTTALTSSANPAGFGGSVTLTATVTGTGGTTPTSGTVTFYDANGTIALGTGTVNGSGVATLSTSALSLGTHSITAAYGGDGNSSSDDFGGSISSTLSQVVVAVGPATHLVYTVVPSSGIAGTPFSVTVQSEDANGNPSSPTAAPRLL